MISIAGFRVGISGSLFNGNFAIVNLEGVSQLFEDGLYGFSNAHVMDYTFDLGNGFVASVGIEDNNSSAVLANGSGGAFGADASDVSWLGKVEYSADFGLIGGVYEYETDSEHEAWKIYGHVDLSEFIPGGIIGGWYMEEDLEATSLGFDAGTRVAADSVWGVAFQMNLTDNVEFMAMYNDVENRGALPDGDLTTLGLNWYPISGLKVFGAYSFGETCSGCGLAGNSGFGGFANAANAAGDVLDFDQFMIGIRRSF